MAQSQVLIFQHVPWEKPGRIAYSLEDCGLDYCTLSVAGEKNPDLPEVADLSGLVIMGGPMGARDFDAYPGLKAENRLAKAAIKAGVPTIGVCLGHQIMAAALGAKVKSGDNQEIGFFPISRQARDSYLPLGKQPQTVLHWHGDTVACPEGGTLLASSQKTKNQAFRYGSALGMQFHLEVDSLLFEEWMSTKEMTGGMKRSDISRLKDDFDRYSHSIQLLADSVFSAFAARCMTFMRDKA